MVENFNTLDTTYLQDRVNKAYANMLALRYLLKTRHVLKNYPRKERCITLQLFSYFIDNVINKIHQGTYNYSISQIERLLTVVSECMFQKLINLQLAKIDGDAQFQPIEAVSDVAYQIDAIFIKDKDNLKDTYNLTKHQVDKHYQKELTNLKKQNYITEKQYKIAIRKNNIPFLKKDIERLSKPNPITKRQNLKSILTFIISFVVLKLFLYFLQSYYFNFS